VAALHHLGDALHVAFAMFWQVLWPLALGFLLSAVIEAVVPKQAVSGALGRDTPRAVALASAFGAASSSCSYAAVALARTLFRKGATLTNAIVFEFASTNLVIELGLALLILLGWRFLAAELGGGLLMVGLLAVLLRLTLRRSLVEEARRQADRGVPGRMEGHAAMDMSVTDGPLLRRLLSARGLTAVSHYFVMNVSSLWTDLVLGFLVSGALAAWVPASWWQRLFLTGPGVGAEVWGAIAGPLVAMASFVCSVGNVPLAAVLWRGGIGFSGVIAFIFADLIIVPILRIYRRYYGARVSLHLLAVSYATMALAGLAVGLLFRALGAVPTNRNVAVLDTIVSWNADTVLDILALVVIGAVTVRFLRTGGVAMLQMMNAGDGDRSAPTGHGDHQGGHRAETGRTR
jgi:uncharacterized protein